MQRYAFKMFLNPGAAHEYRRRHDAIWPELKALISGSASAAIRSSSTPTPTRSSPISSEPTTTG